MNGRCLHDGTLLPFGTLKPTMEGVTGPVAVAS